VKPVLFVVCQEINEAERWAERLRQDDMIGPGDGVLLVTSNSNDTDLAALAAVEDPGSPVRAIVSVNKLGVGWDVKNVAVIVALRKLASEALTEQILGRGLRLPFGRRTSVGAIDRVEIVAHESYRQLLRNKNALLEAEVVDEQGDRRGVMGGRLQIRSPQGKIETLFSALARNPAQDGQVTTDPAFGAVDRADQEFVLLADDHEQILKDLSEAAARPTMMSRCEGAPEIIFPRQEFALTEARQFSVEMIDPEYVVREGRLFAFDPAAYMERVELNVVEDAAGNVVDVIGQAIDRVEATKRRMPFDQLREQLVEAVSSFGLVENTLAEFTVIEEIVDRFLAGAGVEDGTVPEDWSEQRSVQAIAALRALVYRQFKATQPALTRTYTWSFHKVPVVRPMPEVAQDRWERFTQGVWYGPWDNSITPYARFDSDSGEFTFTVLANTSRGGHGVAWWLRLDKQYDREAHLRYGAGRYFPDFVVIDDDGVRWLVEVKDDNRASNDAEVIAKRRLGFEWASATADHKAEIGVTWRYLFVTESEIKASKNSWHALVQRGAHWEQEYNQE
jgi:type III restriction enzyme